LKQSFLVTVLAKPEEGFVVIATTTTITVAASDFAGSSPASLGIQMLLLLLLGVNGRQSADLGAALPQQRFCDGVLVIACWQSRIIAVDNIAVLVPREQDLGLRRHHRPLPAPT